MRRFGLAFFGLFLFGLLAPWSRAQPAPEAPRPDEPRIGVEIGYGGATSNGQQVPLLSMSASAMRRFGPVLLSARGTGSVMVFSDAFADAALLFGLAAGDGLGRASLSAGPALTLIERVPPLRLFPVLGSDRERRRSTIIAVPGLALSAKLRLTPHKPLRLVVGAFGNLNREEAFGGLTLNVRGLL